MTEYFSKRYGSYESFKRALAVDPVGVAADISILFTAGGGAARIAARGGATASRTLPAGAIANGVGGAANALNKAGAGMGTAGKYTDPVYLSGKAVGKVVGPLPEFVQKKITAMPPQAGTAASRARTIAGVGVTAHSVDKSRKEGDKKK